MWEYKAEVSPQMQGIASNVARHKHKHDVTHLKPPQTLLLKLCDYTNRPFADICLTKLASCTRQLSCTWQLSCRRQLSCNSSIDQTRLAAVASVAIRVGAP